MTAEERETLIFIMIAKGKVIASNWITISRDLSQKKVTCEELNAPFLDGSSEGPDDEDEVLVEEGAGTSHTSSSGLLRYRTVPSIQELRDISVGIDPFHCILGQAHVEDVKIVISQHTGFPFGSSYLVVQSHQHQRTACAFHCVMRLLAA